MLTELKSCAAPAASSASTAPVREPATGSCMRLAGEELDLTRLVALETGLIMAGQAASRARFGVIRARADVARAERDQGGLQAIDFFLERGAGRLAVGPVS
jgi:hypothetical protein